MKFYDCNLLTNALFKALVLSFGSALMSSSHPVRCSARPWMWKRRNRLEPRVVVVLLRDFTFKELKWTRLVWKLSMKYGGTRKICYRDGTRQIVCIRTVCTTIIPAWTSTSLTQSLESVTCLEAMHSMAGAMDQEVKWSRCSRVCFFFFFFFFFWKYPKKQPVRGWLMLGL